MIFKVNEQQAQALVNIVNNCNIKGMESPIVAELLYILKNPKEDTDDTSEK